MAGAGLKPTAATLDAALHPMSGVSIADALRAVRHMSEDAEHCSDGAAEEATESSAEAEASPAAGLVPRALPSAFLRNRLLTLAARDGDWRLSLQLLATPLLGRAEDGRAGDVIGATIAIRTLGKSGQWGAALGVLERLFGPGPEAEPEAGGAGEASVDLVLLQTAAEECVRCHHATKRKAAPRSLGPVAVASAVVAFLGDLNVAGRFAVPQDAANAALTAAVAAAVAHGSSSVGGFDARGVRLGLSLLRGALAPRSRGGAGLPFDEAPFLVLLRTPSAVSATEPAAGPSAKADAQQARGAAAEAAAEVWEALLDANQNGLGVSPAARAAAAQAWAQGGQWSRVSSAFAEARAAGQPVAPAFLRAALAAAAAESFDAEACDEALAAGVAAMASVVRAQARNNARSAADGSAAGGVSAADLNGALDLLARDGRHELAFACAHALSVSRDPLTHGLSGADPAGDDYSDGDRPGRSGRALVRGDLGTFHAAMGAALGAGLPDEALAVLADLRASGVAPDGTTRELAVAAAQAQKEAQQLAK